MKARPALLALALLGMATLLSTCTISRMVVFQFSDIKDYKRFPSNPIAAPGTPFIFPSSPNAHFPSEDLLLPSQESKPTLDALLAESNTVAFLVIQRDTLRYERYFEEYTEDSWVASFSMAKSFTSALVGIAIAEGYIGGVEEKVVKYIPELEKRGWGAVTIEQVLQMTTGVHHAENYFNPFAGVARSYYGRGLSRQVTRLKLEAEPGTTFGYKSINTQILGEILQRATGRSLADYMEEKLWQPLGMEHSASWSLDQRRKGIEKAFCCLNATARDFAKFGRLYLHGGNWNGNQLVPADWVAKSTQNDQSGASPSYYQYQWWIPFSDGSFAAEGHLGQFIFVHPERDLIIVRLGINSGGVNWYRVFKDIASQI